MNDAQPISSVPNKFGESYNPQNYMRNVEDSSLIGYLVPKIKSAREFRDSDGRKERWEEYTRLWRGMWGATDKNRDSERSKLIAPALQQAIEMTVAEMVEATFGRTAWIDIDDDLADEEKGDAVVMRDQLLEDFEENAVPHGIRQTFLLGAIYGTGISKVDVREKIVREPRRNKDGSLEVLETTKVVVEVLPIRPDQFVIDEAAQSVEDAMFVAHELVVPRHIVEERQATGQYKKKGYIPDFSGGYPNMPKLDGIHSRGGEVEDSVLITEVFCNVPARMIKGATPDAAGRVEAIVVLANEDIVLKAVESPFTMRDRPIVAYPHEVIPGEFWGRGVAEKGYNPQKALDAELRARIDALALTTAPMMGADVTRMPRNPDLRVRPGKIWMTRGRPSEILEPIQFAPINPVTFQQTGDLERMVQMGTGAMDSATPNNINRRNETASGMSQLNAGFIKRAKMTMHNIEQMYLDKLIKKALWRYMQFDPARYPQDYKFIVNSTMGIMAREVEQSTLTELMGFLPPENPAHKIILGAILANTSSANEKETRAAFEQLTAPPSEEEQQMQKMAQQLQMRLQQAEVSKVEAEVYKLQAEAKLAEAKQIFELVKADLEDDKVEIQAANAVTGAERIRRESHKTSAGLAGKIVDAKAKIAVAKEKPKSSPTNGGG